MNRSPKGFPNGGTVSEFWKKWDYHSRESERELKEIEEQIANIENTSDSNDWPPICLLLISAVAPFAVVIYLVAKQI